MTKQSKNKNILVIIIIIIIAMLSYSKPLPIQSAMVLDGEPVNAQFDNYDFSFGLYDHWYAGYWAASDNTRLWIFSSGQGPKFEQKNLVDGSWQEDYWWRPDGAMIYCGIYADNTYVWVCKSDIMMPYTKHIKWYTHDQTEIGRFNLSNSQPGGIVIANNHIYVQNAGNKIYEYDLSGNLQGNYDIAQVCRDFTYMGNQFYCTTSGQIAVYDMNWTYVTSHSINPVIETPWGITSDGNNIWIADATDDQRIIYRFPASVVELECTDSDGGVDDVPRIFDKGTVTIGGNSYTDECIDFDRLREYFCTSDGGYSDMVYTCSNLQGFTCRDGKCDIAEKLGDLDNNGNVDWNEINAAIGTWLSGDYSWTQINQIIGNWLN